MGQATTPPDAADPEARRLAEQGLGWGVTPDDYPAPSQCLVCAHRAAGAQYPKPVCRAFLGGIPAEFLDNEIDHRKPVAYDGGIQFEPRPDVAADVLGRLYIYLDNACGP